MNNTTLKKEPVIAKEFMVTFWMLVSCFMLWGLLNNMSDTLVPAFAKIFMMKAADSSLIQVAFYGAYACLAIPASLIIRKFSYRNGVLVGLGFYIVGAFGYVPAAMFQSYTLFLVAIFILASGMSILETTCNPFILSLGSKETSVRRLNLAQAFNPLGSITGLLLAKFIILSHLNPSTLEERQAMDSTTLSNVRASELLWVCIPYLGLIIIALIIWFFFFKSQYREKDQEGNMAIASTFKLLIKQPQYITGVVAQFFYVGLQTTVWTWIIKYGMVNLNLNEAKAAEYYIASIVLFIACRWLCTALMKVLDPAKIMACFAVTGMGFTLLVIYAPVGVAMMALVALSGCMSLMFPTIYGIALGKLGNEVKLGAAGLIMAIIGGAVITPIMGQFIDNGTLNTLVPSFVGEVASVRSSFFIVLVCFAVVLAYAVAFRQHKVK